MKLLFKMTIKFVLKKYQQVAFKYQLSKLLEGFTIIESLISLSIIMMIASLFPMMLVQMNHISGHAVNHQDINIHLFLREMHEEMKGEDINVENKRLFIPKTKVSYEFHNHRIVRKKDGEGYIIMLEKIDDASFFKLNETIWVELKVKINVQTYEVRFQLR